MRNSAAIAQALDDVIIGLADDFAAIDTTFGVGDKRSAIHHLIHTFFRGSREKAVAALLEVSPSQFSEDELDRLARLIDKARKGGKR